MKQYFATAARVILIAALSCMGADKAFCNIIIIGPAPADHIHQLPATDSDDSITLNPDPVTYLAEATPAMRVALAADFPIWTFTYAAGLNGTLHIFEYSATTEQDDNGGGLIDATYTRAATDPAIADLHWIQLVVTNFPASGKPTTGYLDNDATGLPFYTFDIQNGNKTDTTFDFFDNSSRNAEPTPTSLRGEVNSCLVPGTIIIQARSLFMMASIGGGTLWMYPLWMYQSQALLLALGSAAVS